MNNENPIVWFLTLLFLGAIAVLIITHWQSATQAFGSVFTIGNDWAQVLSGGTPTHG